MLAIVLARHNFREADQIISLYTEKQGKIECLARGVKKIISKNSSFLEPGSLVEADIVAGKEINHLTKVQPVNLFTALHSNLDKLLIAGYGLFVADKLLKISQSDKRIFWLLKNWLEYLSESDNPTANLAYSFIAKLSFLLGVSPKLDACVHCDRDEVSGFYYSGGGVVCSACVVRVRERGVDLDVCTKPEMLGLVALWSGNWSDAEAVKYQKTLKITHKFISYHHEQKFAYFKGI
ncbi:MAG: DNA repair protein RecO [bacterium]|nr:DNA repair protein RecO [bacterium]